MSVNLTWQEPRANRSGVAILTKEILDALAERPGKHAVIVRRTAEARKGLYVLCSQWNRRFPDYQFTCRTEGDETILYGCKRVA